MPNFGDVALNLGPNWDRSKLSDQNYGLLIVGHNEGVPDVYLEDDPEKRHQFAWVDKLYRNEVDVNRSRGYHFVKVSEGWVKNPNLWDVTPDNEIQCMGMSLMARSDELYAKDLQDREDRRKKAYDKNNPNATDAIAELKALADRLGFTLGDKSARKGRKVA